VSRSRRRRTRLCGVAVTAAAALLAVPGAASADVTSTFAGEKLTVSSNAGDAITIECVDGNVKVNSADPGAVVACSAVGEIEVNADDLGNTINLNDVTVADFTKPLTKVTVNGRGGNDTVQGSEFADVLNGEGGIDRLVAFRNPAGTRDVMTGGEGDDTLVWNNGDGSDTMDGEAGNDTIEVNGSGAAGDEFTVKPSATQGRIAFDRVNLVPFNLDIGTSERLDVNGGGGDDSLNKDGGAAGLAPFVIDADGGEGNDVLNTGDAPDILTGGNGNDRLVAFRNPAGTRDVMAGGEGDDILVWNNGDGSDTMDGEGGNDTVEVNGAGADGDEFTVKPSSTQGRVAFDRVNLVPFNLDIGSSERLNVNGGGGDDKIIGSKGLAGLISGTFVGNDGNDRIKGTDAEDLVSGGNGNDVINTRDKAEDAIECDRGFDIVRGCEIVLGGRLRVKHLGKAITVAGNAASVKLRCVASRRCTGKVRLLSKGKSLGSAKFVLKGRKAKRVRIRMNARGLRLLAKAPAKGLSVKLRIDARDSRRNGWRTTDSLKLKG
jgi:Ca2+-binding RTX toxin-like protein